MPIQHSIDSVVVPQTRTAQEVLGDMGLAVQRILERPGTPPPIEALIAQGRLRYAYEPEGRDDYLAFSEWPVVGRQDWERHRELLWEYPVTIVGQGISSHTSRVSIDDCDGFSTHGVARRLAMGARAWCLVQEFREASGRLRGWHALALYELPETSRHCAEVPWPRQAFVLEHLWPAQARPGHRLAVIDLAWMAGMPRKEEGLFPMDRLELVPST